MKRPSLSLAIPVLLLAFSALRGAAATDPFGLIRFKKCLSPKVPRYFPGSEMYKTLAARNYRNDAGVPRVIVLPRTEWEVQTTVRCARLTDLQVCVRSGGHSLIGNSLCNGILLDAGNFKQVYFANQQHDLVVGASATLGEIQYHAWTKRRRWTAAGVCPGVGAAGYTLGGGYGPYASRLGLACDALQSVRVVDMWGNMRVASRWSNKELFWASCGGGGGHFGVVTSMRVRTFASRPFDRSVVFRFRWPHARIGELVSKWQTWDEAGGKAWLRLEMYRENAEPGMIGYGACYDVSSTQACMNVLQRAAFFNVPGRETLFLAKTKNALDLQAFFGPDADWARKLAPDTKAALVGKRYTDSGNANTRAHKSTFLSLRRGGRKPPSKEFWQQYAAFCARPGRESIVWLVCELSLFRNTNNRAGRPTAFPFRGSDVLTHFIIGDGTTVDKRFAYFRMKNLLKAYTDGVYVNYPEPELKKWEYARMYWGKSLARLSKLKKWMDPTGLLYYSQPIPPS